MTFAECVRFPNAPVPGATLACANCKWHDKASICKFEQDHDSDDNKDSDTAHLIAISNESDTKPVLPPGKLIYVAIKRCCNN